MTKKELQKIVDGLVAGALDATLPGDTPNDLASEDVARTLVGTALRRLRATIVESAVPPAMRPEGNEWDRAKAAKAQDRAEADATLVEAAGTVS